MTSEELKQLGNDIESVYKIAYNKALDDLVSKMESEYYNKGGTQFDNAILEMKRFTEQIKQQ